MGADMAVKVFWTDEKPTVEKALAAVRETLPTLDLETLHVAASFAGVELEDLERAVVDVGDDPALLAVYRERIESGYRTQIGNFIEALTHRRDVTEVVVGPLTGYLTGGMSYGDAPTDAWQDWDDFFADNDDEGFREIWNPCANEIWSALFISPNEQWAIPGDRYCASVEIATKAAPAEAPAAEQAAAGSSAAPMAAA